MSSYSRLGKAFEESTPIPAEDYIWDCQEHFYWGAALALIIEAKTAAGGREIQDLSPIVACLVSVIASRNGSARERNRAVRTLLRRMKPEDPDIYPRHEYAFLARELLRIALKQIKQRQ